MNYEEIDKKVIDFIVSELVDGIGEVESALHDCPIDYGDRKDCFENFLKEFFTQKSFEKRNEE